MRILFLALSFQFIFNVHGQSLAEVRENFHLAVLDPDKSRKFYEFLKDAPTNTPTLKAYKATSEAMLARALWNPFSKYKHVLKYSDMIEGAIYEDSENVEIRFLRLSIEYNLPRFLGMSNHLKEDRDTIVENLTSVYKMDIDPSFCRYIIYFLNDTGLCTEEEIALMEKALPLRARK
jgi:hypothetical protein